MRGIGNISSMRARSVKYYWLGSAALTALLIAPAAQAQQSGGIETVIVTAEKRAEDAQKVPIAMSTISGDSLDSQGIVGFEDLSARVPSLRFGAGVTGGEHVVTLRGLGSQNTTSGGDSPVAYSVDGVYQARTTAVDPEFYDVARIEVLRGPQGTLYGRNSVGGSINVITNKPTDEFGAALDVLYGNYDAWTVRGWVNIPLTQADSGGAQVAARLTGVSSQHDAYQKNFSTVPGHTNRSDGQDFYMLRGQVLFDFTPKVSFLLSGNYSENNDPVATKLAWGTAPLANQARFVGQVYDPNPRHSSAGFPDRLSQKNYGVSGTLNWDFGGATLTSITAYSKGKWFQTNDADSSNLDIAHLNYWTMDAEQFSEEVRIASNTSESPLSWIAGFFYFHETVKQGFEFIDTGLNAPLGTAFAFTNGGTIKTTSWAPFGQLDFDFAKTSWNVPLTLTAGLRYSNDSKKINDFLNYAVTDFGLNFPQAKIISPGWSQITGKVGLAYQASENTMLYANASRGYLAGGELVGNFPGVYGPESAWNYEAGFKSTFADNRVQLNTSAFYTRIRNMQVFVQDITGSRIDNAGKAHVEGVEAELTALPVEGLRLNLGVSLMKAKYDEYKTINNRYAGPGPGCDPITAICDFKGNRLIQTPKYSVSLGAEYNFDTAIGTITPRADVYFSGDVYFLSANTANDRQGAYSQTNLSLGWVSTDGRWNATAFVRNLENADVISNDGLQANTIGMGYGIDNYTYFPPRTFGLRIGLKL